MSNKDLFENLVKFIEAEEIVFKNAGKEYGEVKFICPICGGNAVSIRTKVGSRINGLGSGCDNCGLKHT